MRVRIALLCLCASVSNVSAETRSYPFNIAVPKDVTVSDTAGRDFDIWYFNKGGVTYAGIYFGAMPAFGKRDGDAIQQAVECKDRKPIKRDVLLRLGDGRFLHVWDFEDNGQAALARAILTSIRVPGKNEGLREADLVVCPR